MHKKEFTPYLEKIIYQLQNKQIYYENIYRNPDKIEGKNEYLFFLKPEITLDDEAIKLPEILDIVIDKMNEYNLDVTRINALSAKYLFDHKIIDNHYGVINRIAGDAINEISETARKQFKTLYGDEPENSNILGGLEFINEYTEYSPKELNALWEQHDADKLAGGTYCVPLEIEGKKVYLVNGFHPLQLEHFTQKGRSIVTFNLVSDTDWHVARESFIGATNPKDAKKGSLRNMFNEQQEELGLYISPSRNGAHLSAGPVEGLIELMRYDSNFSKNIMLML
ncbi:MAG: hypothetical protein ACOC4B_00910 [Bacteroidota bacterium]